MSESGLVRTFRDLRVYGEGLDAGMRLFQWTKGWPPEEKFSLTDQIRRSSRSVCANIAEAWRKRRYPAQFVSKLSDADAEAAEIQTWLDFAFRCGYIDETVHREMNAAYDRLSAGLVRMMAGADGWCGPSVLREDPPEYGSLLSSGGKDLAPTPPHPHTPTLPHPKTARPSRSGVNS